jgi:hypothetical protein
VKIRFVIATGLVALVLSGCAGIPSTGGVESGKGRAVVVDPLVPVAPVPDPTDEPVTLTDKFIQACAAGVSGTFAAAEAYLAPSARATWDPEAKVTVFGSGDFTPVWNEAAKTVTYSLPVIATVDSAGIFTEVDPGAPQNVVFAMSQESSGQWRISGIENGIVLAQAHFDDLFRSVPLAFASADGKFVVPDLRWVPRGSAATFAVNALLGGPSAWLADAVQTGIPVTTSLALQAVPITNGSAAVALNAGAAGTAAQRALARVQLVKTLTRLPDISSVSVTIGGLPLEADASALLNDAPIPGTTAVAFVEGRLGTWEADALSVVPAAVGVLPDGANSPALAYDGTTAAFLVHQSTLVTTNALASGTVPLDAGAKLSEPVMPVTVAYSGTNLVAPSFDWYGWLWTAERSGTGSLVAIPPGGSAQEVSVPWLEGREVGAVRVSHDGARVAVLSREGGIWRLDVAALIRDSGGVPRSVGLPLSVGLGVGPASHVVWVDDVTVAVLADGPAGTTPSLGVSVVGGGTTVLTTSPDAVGVAARNGTSSVAVVTRDGAIFQRSTAGWSRVPVVGVVGGLAFSG